MISNLNKKIYKHIERWRTQKIEGSFAYGYLDAIVLKRSWDGEIKNVSGLAGLPQRAQETRPRGRQSDDLRCPPGAGRVDCRGLPG
jgi:hypothetical protein